MSTNYYLVPRAETDEPVACAHWGGNARGTIVHIRKVLPDETLLLSTYDELTSVGLLKATRGAGRKAVS